MTLLRTMGRRWRIVAPILMVTVLLITVIVGISATTYASDGSLLLVSSSEEGIAQEIAPEVAVGVLVNTLRQPTTSRSLVGADNVTYQTSVDDSGVVVSIQFTGADSVQIAAVAQRVLDAVPGLVQRGLGDRAAESIRITPLSTPSADDVVLVSPGPTADGVPAPPQPTLSVSLAVLSASTAGSNSLDADTSTARAVVDLVRRPAVALAVDQVAPGASFEANLDERPVSPIVLISIETERADQIGPAFDAMLGAINTELALLQESAGTTTVERTVAIELDPPRAGTQSSTDSLRAALALAVLGLAIAALAAVAADTRVMRARPEPRT